MSAGGWRERISGSFILPMAHETHVMGMPKKEMERAGIELGDGEVINISKFVQNILLFLSYFSISVTQKYVGKQQASGLSCQSTL